MIQRNFQWLFGIAIVLLGGWIIHGFLAALIWASVLALATWPLYKKVSNLLPVRQRPYLAAPLFTFLVGLVLIVPLGLALIQISVEVQYLVRGMMTAQKVGVAAPVWLERLPGIGVSAASWWNNVLGTPGGVLDWFHQIEPARLLHWARIFSVQMVHRIAILGFTLLALFFLYRDGAVLGRQLLVLGNRALGEKGERYATHAVSTVRATVNGLVLVGVGVGILLGIAYAIAGVPSAAIWGAATGFIAMIPFAAPIIFGAASLYLLTQGSVTAAILLFSWGALVLFIADHFIRPGLIGGEIKLPFLWVLLGILGGLETFGVLGLFLGPVVMSIAITLWRDWTDDLAENSA